MPSVVYLLCGLTGSGKTTYAKRLEAGGAVRLSVDEEVYARHGRYGVEAHGGRWRLLYFKADRQVLVQRLAERNRRDDANGLAVTPSALEDFFARFDEPVDEGEELVDSGGAARRPGRPEGEASPR